MWCGTKKLADDKHIDFLRRHYCHEPCPVQKDPSKYCNKCGGKKSAWSGKGAHAKTCPNYTPPERNGSPDRKHKKGTDRSAERTSTKRVQFAGADDDDDGSTTDDEVTSKAFVVRVRVNAVAKRDVGPRAAERR